ncbi:MULTISPECIES: adenylate/guanylate cyclase domain-containing protein [Bacillus]|uniref:Adenylate cyclase n=1 Tax=Bacillus sonorensis TaxID=119858 RepID=A0ABN5AJM0_9BACI|nr:MULTISPECIES: adenylate/guanylate cyclase domain-containing protein [Bacillus]ASB89329.1 Adenylate cyclase [Bacillus sonorensis]MEC0338358.1 adenylate/guanylate cyclase domain-containing protein [Bacillus sonorensis]MEC0425215.1 adenylate/guanylate cyclase domain-containing protein [Bacillus sonorensis]MEC0460769.1 adenylate/guanylate cyclase domain-containing protein [Bacillus sonorensis]MEC0526424.1 adenylate/guanylate cyclase domain-containing protein [Bacillus sonorensis]
MENWKLDKLEEIKYKLSEVFDSEMKVQDYDGGVVPSVEELEDVNIGLVVSCSILFVDIRGSTSLSDSSWAKSMAKIYRAFVRAIVMCINYSGGSVRQIVGDRVMGVFVDDEDRKSTEKALEAARAILTVIDNYFNPKCQETVNGKQIECGIGIDYGNVLLTQVGMKLREEESKDLVWAGKIANIASKHTDMAEPGEIFITQRFFDGLPFQFKKDHSGNDLWNNVLRFKNEDFFKGYVIKNYYLDCFQHEQEIRDNDNVNDEKTVRLKAIPNIKDNEITPIQKADQVLTLAFQKMEDIVRKQDELKSLEKELLKRGERIQKKESELNIKEKTISQRKITAEYEIKTKILYDQLDTLTLEGFRSLYDEVVILGNKIGKSNVQVKNDLHYWKLISFLEDKDIGWAYRLIKEQLRNSESKKCFEMPNPMVVEKIVKRLNKIEEYIELIQYTMKHYSKDYVAYDKNDIKDSLIRLGVSPDYALELAQINM